MKVLFVSSGNRNNGPGVVVFNQAESLRHENAEISFFSIKGKGARGYLRNVILLTRFLRKNHPFDIIHSHYSLSAYVTTIALVLTSDKTPHIVSLMGSDVKKKGLSKFLIKTLSNRAWNNTIVKTSSMLLELGLDNACIIPNGVDLSKISYIESKLSVSIGKKFNRSVITLLFIADPSRPEKNYKLAEESVKLLNGTIILKPVYNVDHDTVIRELLSGDLLLLTSFREGSPNIIKEAMACNCPVVATDVGDIKWLFGDEPGHFLGGYRADDLAAKIKQAIDFARKSGRTNGRDRLIKLGLDSASVASRIIKIYEGSLQKTGLGK